MLHPEQHDRFNPEDCQHAIEWNHVMHENPYKSPTTDLQRSVSKPEPFVLVVDEPDEDESDYPLIVAPIIACIAAMLLALVVTLM